MHYLQCFGVALGQPVTPPRLSIQPLANRGVRITWPNTAAGFVLEEASAVSSTLWQEVGRTPIEQDNQFAVTIDASAGNRFFRLRLPLLTTIEETSPVNGETGVAVIRETIVRFTAPLSTNAVVGTNNFYAGFGGRRLLSRVELSSDRTKATLFYLEPLPGSTRVVAVLDGTALTDFLGRPLDADGDGQAGGSEVIAFDTLSLTALTGTAVVGRVFASELMPGADTGTNAVNRPLEGVTITVDGREEDLRTTTDAMGNFTLTPVPPGRFFVKIDGRTAKGSVYPSGAYYPYVGKAWDAVAGRTNNLAGGTGDIFLPLITAGTLQPVSMTQDTSVEFPSEVIASNPALAGVSITVSANSLFSDDGTRGGRVGIAPVPPDRLPGPLPPGLEMPIVITVQTDGALNFDKPAPVCFPNLPDPVTKQPLPARSKQALISFNHKKGVWEAVGSMTVSADGKLVCTDPGVGIVQPGWHGVAPDPHDPDPCPGECCQGPPPPPSPAGLQTMPLSPRRQRSTTNTRITLAGLNAQRENTTPPDAGGVSIHGAVLPSGPGGGQCNPCPNDTNDHQRDICSQMCNYKHEGCVVKCTFVYLLGWGECPAVWDCDTSLTSQYDFLSCASDCNKEVFECHDACGREFPFCDSSSPQKAHESVGSGAGGLELAHAQGATPILDRIAMDVERAVSVLRPYHLSRSEVPADVAQQVTALFAEADAIAGGSALAYVRARALEHEDKVAALEAEIGPALGNAPAYPVRYFAKVARPNGGVLHLRGETGPFGDYSLFVPRDGTLLFVSFYDPHTKRYGLVTPRLRPDVLHKLPRFFLHSLPPDAPDFDHDGLPDVVEAIYGTDPGNADTDGDGIPDGAEVENGTNPLDGLPTQTGIIATAKTPGPAVDVCVANDLVILAELDKGVSVFNVFNGMNPTLIAQVPMPGNALRVSSVGNFIAVAADDAGLVLIDASDPATARIVNQFRFGSGAQAVAAGGGMAYVGLNSGTIAAVEPASGLFLDQLDVTNAVRDLTLAGDYLYALTDYRLYAIAISPVDGTLSVTGATDSPFTIAPNKRLVAGGGIAYAVHGNGYNPFDLADPAHPALIKAGSTTQFGWQQMAANGSGLGLAAVGPNSTEGEARDVSLYDLSNVTNTDGFITTFPTPGHALAVAIYKGLAYVADREAGLQVINYLAYDSKGVAPRISLSASFPLNLAQVESGARVRITANAVDDVQVRDVELYLDGAKVETDGNFPFEFFFAAPRLAVGKTSFKVRAKATDTGGNATWSDELSVSLLPDITPPKVALITPRKLAGTVNSVSALFNELMDPASLTSSAFELFSAGPDGVPGTADDALVAGGNLSIALQNGANAAVLTFSGNLPLGVYRVVVGRGAADRAGNHLAAVVTSDFRLLDGVFWTNSDGGDWSEPRNWSTGSVPGPNDTAVIATPIPVLVTHSHGTNSIGSLITANPFLLSGGRLEINGTLQANDRFEIFSGTLAHARLVPGSAASSMRLAATGNNPAPILDGVTLDADVMLANAAYAEVVNGLTLNGSLTVAGGLGLVARLYFTGTQTLGGTGQVVFGEAGFNYLSPRSGTLTIGPAVTIRGGNGSIGEQSWPLINQGTISADRAGSALTFIVAAFTNQGTVEVKNGAELTLGGSWTNTGTLRLNEGTLNLGGSFTTAGLGNLERTGGKLNISGTLDNTGATVALNANTGSWILQGTIRGGHITTSGGATLVARGTLDGVTLDTDLALEPGSRITVRNGLTLNATLTLGGAGGSTGLDFPGAQTLGGNGQVVFANTGYNVIYIQGALTIGPAITIRGGSGRIEAAVFPLINEGNIIVDGANQTFGVRGGPFTNRGTVQISNGATVTLEETWSNPGIVRLNESTLDLGGTFTTADLGIIQRTGGTVIISGTLDNTGVNNTGATLALNASTGSWLLGERATIRGGTITSSDGATLQVAPPRFASGTLDGVTLDMDLTLGNSVYANVANGLTINGTLTLAAGTSGAGLYFAGAQTLGGQGQVVLAGMGENYLSPRSGTLTIGPALTVRGGRGTIGQPGLPLVNEGTISADVAGGVITILGNPFTNNGTTQELNGGRIVIVP